MNRAKLISASEFCMHYTVSYDFITGLQESGLIRIIDIDNTPYVQQEDLKELETLVRFHTDLDINIAGIEAVSHLLKQIRELQSELKYLKERLRLYE